VSTRAIENGIFRVTVSYCLMRLQKPVHYSAGLTAFAVQRKHASNGPASFDCIYVALFLYYIVIFITIGIVLKIRG